MALLGEGPCGVFRVVELGGELPSLSSPTQIPRDGGSTGLCPLLYQGNMSPILRGDGACQISHRPWPRETGRQIDTTEPLRKGKDDGFAMARNTDLLTYPLWGCSCLSPTQSERTRALKSLACGYSRTTSVAGKPWPVRKLSPDKVVSAVLCGVTSGSTWLSGWSRANRRPGVLGLGCGEVSHQCPGCPEASGQVSPGVWNFCVSDVDVNRHNSRGPVSGPVAQKHTSWGRGGCLQFVMHGMWGVPEVKALGLQRAALGLEEWKSKRPRKRPEHKSSERCPVDRWQGLWPVALPLGPPSLQGLPMQRGLDTATVSSKTLSVLRGQPTPHTESKKPVYK